MDENLVVDAIQYTNEKEFHHRFRFFDNAAERNGAYQRLIEMCEEQNRPKDFCKVEVTMRVETIRGDN